MLQRSRGGNCNTCELIPLTENLLKICALSYRKRRQVASIDIQALQGSMSAGVQLLHRQSRAVHLCDVSLHHNIHGRARQTHDNRKSRVIHRIAIMLTHLDRALSIQHFKGSRLCTRHRNGRLADLHALRATVRRYSRAGI